MLYVTTRTDRDAYTAHRAMLGGAAPDGGQFLPRVSPAFGREVLDAVAGRSFSDNVAWVLSQLWGRKISGWDIDVELGKQSVSIRDLDSRTIAAEIWHDPEVSFQDLALRMFRMMVNDPMEKPGQWFYVSLRIALIFGVFAELAARGEVSSDKPLDIAVPSFDFQYPMALWYARRWGLPIGRIICACNENNAPWTLLHQGEMRTDAPLRHTYTAACDQTVPGGLERLIHAVLGPDEALRYASLLGKQRMYTLNAAQQNLLRRGVSVCVVSQRRMEFMLPNLFAPGHWTPDPYAAMAYTALVDHRAHAGKTGKALILSEGHPIFYAEMLSEAMGVSADQLRDVLRGE